MKVQNGCCSCSEGGEEIAVNIEYANIWYELLSQKCDLDEVSCPGVFTCSKGIPRCIDGICTIESGCSTVGDLGDCNGKWIEVGLDDRGCPLDPVCVPLEYCITREDCRILEDIVDLGCPGEILWSCDNNICNDSCSNAGEKLCMSDSDCALNEACVFSSSTAVGTCIPYSDCQCSSEYSPVCGLDGRTYPNICIATCIGADVIYSGECGKECGDSYNPLCGFDGITYLNRCYADSRKAGFAYQGTCRRCKDESDCYQDEWCMDVPIEVCPNPESCSNDSDCQKEGASCMDGLCQVWDDGSACNCPLIDLPVCGMDGVTYLNRCVAECLGIEVAFDGLCSECDRRERGVCMPYMSCYDVMDCISQGLINNQSCGGFWICARNLCEWVCAP